MPGCFVPVSNTRESHANSDYWSVFFSCIAHKDGCNKTLTVTGNVQHLKTSQPTKIAFLCGGPPCVNPSFAKYGYYQRQYVLLVVRSW